MKREGRVCYSEGSKCRKCKDYTDFIPALELEANKVLSTGASYMGLSIGGGKFWVTLDKLIKSKAVR